VLRARLKKRYRIPKVDDGELLVRFGKAPGDSTPDICYYWGAGIHRCDARYVANTFATKRWVAPGANVERFLTQKFRPNGGFAIRVLNGSLGPWNGNFPGSGLGFWGGW